MLNPTLIIGPLLSDADSGSATVSYATLRPQYCRIVNKCTMLPHERECSQKRYRKFQIVGRMLSFTTFLAAPPMYVGVVDVRDVATAHVEVSSISLSQ